MMTVPDRITPGYLVSRRCVELPAASEESAAIIIGVTARHVVTRGVIVQKSAAAIVVFRYFTRVADHEGPNMRSRTEQWAARSSTTKTDRASRGRHGLKMLVLCAFCKQPVRVRMSTSHERPTADPHGGWCGGWELKTPGYPNKPHLVTSATTPWRQLALPLNT